MSSPGNASDYGNDYEIFQSLYKNYAPVVYGLVSKCTTDEGCITSILTDVFSRLMMAHKSALPELRVIQVTFKSITETLGQACALLVLKDYQALPANNRRQ